MKDRKIDLLMLANTHMIKFNDLLSRCKTKKQKLEFISDNIFYFKTMINLLKKIK